MLDELLIIIIIKYKNVTQKKTRCVENFTELNVMSI
jgi:hypothetical protein